MSLLVKQHVVPMVQVVFHYDTIEFLVLADRRPYNLTLMAHHVQLLHQTDFLQCVDVVVLQ